MLEAALEGYAARAAAITSQMAALRRRISGEAAPTPATPARRVISAKGRKAIAAAQKKRWEKYTPPTPISAPAKRKLSRAAKKRMAAGQKRRWANARAAQAAG